MHYRTLALIQKANKASPKLNPAPQGKCDEHVNSLSQHSTEHHKMILFLNLSFAIYINLFQFESLEVKLATFASLFLGIDECNEYRQSETFFIKFAE